MSNGDFSHTINKRDVEDTFEKSDSLKRRKPEVEENVSASKGSTEEKEAREVSTEDKEEKVKKDEKEEKEKKNDNEDKEKDEGTRGNEEEKDDNIIDEEEEEDDYSTDEDDSSTDEDDTSDYSLGSGYDSGSCGSSYESPEED